MKTVIMLLRLLYMCMICDENTRTYIRSPTLSFSPLSPLFLPLSLSLSLPPLCPSLSPGTNYVTAEDLTNYLWDYRAWAIAAAVVHDALRTHTGAANPLGNQSSSTAKSPIHLLAALVVQYKHAHRSLCARDTAYRAPKHTSSFESGSSGGDDLPLHRLAGLEFGLISELLEEEEEGGRGRDPEASMDSLVEDGVGSLGTVSIGSRPSYPNRTVAHC